MKACLDASEKKSLKITIIGDDEMDDLLLSFFDSATPTF